MPKKYILALFGLFCGLILIKFTWPRITAILPQNQKPPSIIIKEKTLLLEIADTPQKQSQGLVGHQPLSDNQAMLFPYSPPQQVSFWKKGMSFPIDIIYIASSQIVQIYSQVPAPSLSETNLKTYPSNQAVDYVLETQAGWTDKYGIEMGDKVILQL